MRRIREGWNTLRRNRRSGVSLIVALCAVAVLIGLSLSIVYSSSMLLSRANRKIGRERCYQLAQSFAQVLDGELRAYNTEKDLGNAETDKISPENTFYRWANLVLDKYAEYDPDNADTTTYYYTAGSADDDYGKITVMLRKENSADVNQDPTSIENPSFAYEQRDSKTKEIAERTFIRYQLSVSVKVEKGADSFIYTTEYYRKDGFEPRYTWNGEIVSDIPVYWVNGSFCRSANGTDVIEPGTVHEGTDTRGEVVTIRYTYDKNNPTYKVYEPIYGESGGAADG